MSIKNIVDGLARATGAMPSVDRDARTLTDGSPVTEDHRDLKPNGQQKDYVVLSEEERKRGFVRPVRRSYIHVGRPGPKYPLRDLTPEEHGRNDKYGYVKYEEYPPGARIIGRYWTQAMLDRIGKGCGATTSMGQSIAETYARDPGFYVTTFCCGCRNASAVGADGEFVWIDNPDQRVGT